MPTETDLTAKPTTERRNIVSSPLPITRQAFLLSFQFSQGSSAVQHWIFRWLHHERPEARLSEQQQAALYAESVAPARALVARRERHPPMLGDVTEVLTDEIQMLAVCLDEPPCEEQRLVEMLACGILQQDQRFYHRGGRERRHAPQPASQALGHPDGEALHYYNPHTDRWLSHTCYYALQGHTTGHPLYDALFAAVRHFWQTRPLGDPLQLDLREVIATYNATHPDGPVS